MSEKLTLLVGVALALLSLVAVLAFVLVSIHSIVISHISLKTTTDLGQALIDGKFNHVGKIKGPILRGLSARAPYFHNGSARTLLDAVRFYETRFGLSLSAQDESDLVAFLSSL